MSFLNRPVSKRTGFIIVVETNNGPQSSNVSTR